MTRSNDKHAFVVGLFILTGVVIIIAGIFAVGSREKFFSKRFVVKSRFDDVGGLQAGNNIWLSGVKVGTVKAIGFHGDAQVEITMNIEEAARSRIWKNSMTRISTDGFIGNKIVIIYGGTSNAGPVENDDLLKSSKGISTDAVMGVLESSNNNLLQITANLKDITAQVREGKGALGSLVYGKDTEKEIQLTLQHLSQASARGEEVMAGLHEFTSKLNNGKGILHELITDTTIFNSLQVSLNQLNETISKASEFMSNLKEAGNALTEKDNPAGMLLNDQAAAKDLNEIIINLKKGSQKLDEDLKAIQHNFLFRGYFRKKAKGKLQDQ